MGRWRRGSDRVLTVDGTVTFVLISLANAIFSAMAKEPQIDFIDIPGSIREKYQYFTRADISKLREAGYEKPLTPLSEAVKDYVQNYLAKEKRLGD